MVSYKGSFPQKRRTGMEAAGDGGRVAPVMDSDHRQVQDKHKASHLLNIQISVCVCTPFVYINLTPMI